MLGSIFKRLVGDTIGTSLMQMGEEFKKAVFPSSQAKSVREVDAEDLASRAKKAGGGQQYAYVAGARVVTGKADATPAPTMSASELTSMRGSSGPGIKA